MDLILFVMRNLAVGLAIASSLPACASDLWNRRVYACEEVEGIEIDGSQLEIEGDDGEDDCYVEVRNLRNHSFEDGILSGTELTVFASGPVLYDVGDTRVDHESRGLTIEGPRGDYLWLPDDEHLEASNVEDNGEALFVRGPIREIVLEDAGEAFLNPAAGFQTLDGGARRLELQTKTSFERITVVLEEDAILVLPLGELYCMKIDADAVAIQPTISTVEVDPTAIVDVTAGDGVVIIGNSGDTDG